MWLLKSQSVLISTSTQKHVTKYISSWHEFHRRLLERILGTPATSSGVYAGIETSCGLRGHAISVVGLLQSCFPILPTHCSYEYNHKYNVFQKIKYLFLKKNKKTRLVTRCKTSIGSSHTTYAQQSSEFILWPYGGQPLPQIRPRLAPGPEPQNHMTAPLH